MFFQCKQQVLFNLFFGNAPLVNCPYYNINFGVILLSRIQARIKNPTIAKIASIYNFLGAEKVNNYGARVAKIYFEQPWVEKGCAK